jgi:hypothetical protein
MTKKIFAVLALFAFAISSIGVVSADTETANNDQLAVLLPASDGVITVDTKRLIEQALPQMLSANQPMLQKIEANINKIKGETGLDLKQFSEVAIGLKTKQLSGGEIDMEPVILARGTITSKALIAVARLASDGSYTTEKVGDRTVYIFSPQNIVEKNRPTGKTKNSMLDKGFDKMIKQLSREVALTAYDSNTIAFGSVERVKDTISNSPRVSNEILTLLSRNPDAVANMSMNLPKGMSQFVGLDNDDLGANLDSIRQMHGSLNVSGETTSVSLMAKTLDATQAKSLEDTLLGLQQVGKALLGASKGADKKVYAKMVEGLKINRQTNEISLGLDIMQSDLDVIVGKK